MGMDLVFTLYSSMNRISPPFVFPAACRPAGFSLIELLAALALMSLLMASIAPALVSSQRGSSLSHAGNRFADLITTARQTSLSRNVMTAVVLVTDTTDATLNGRVLGLLEMDGDHVWRQAGGWIQLPEAVSARDVNGAAPHNTLPAAADSVPPVLASLKGDPSPGYSALVFYPDGRMRGNAANLRRISVRLSGESQSAVPKNYYDIVINAETAALRIQRP